MRRLPWQGIQPGLRTRPGEREAVTTAGFTVDPVARKAVRDGRLTPARTRRAATGMGV